MIRPGDHPSAHPLDVPGTQGGNDGDLFSARDGAPDFGGSRRDRRVGRTELGDLSGSGRSVHQCRFVRRASKKRIPINTCYLDSTNSAVSVGDVRTTITIDADTEALLRLEVERTGLSFKVVLNQAIKRALGRRASGVQVQPLFAAPFPPELAQQSFNRLDAKWEDEDTILELGS